MRGICCLRPGIPRLSERVRVSSVVDRFLEHSRVWFFQARGERKVYLASGDWMQRNLARRVEVAFPVDDAALKERIVGEILAAMLADNQKSWSLRRDGTYERVQPGAQGRPAAPLRSQEHFISLARRAALADASRSRAVESLLAPAAEPRRRKRAGLRGPR